MRIVAAVRRVQAIGPSMLDSCSAIRPSRLWPTTVADDEATEHARSLQDVAGRIELERVTLITTDGCEFYKRVIRRILGPACLYGQVIKTCRNDRSVKVERRTLIGDSTKEVFNIEESSGSRSVSSKSLTARK